MDSIYVQNNQGNITELSDQAIQNFQSGLKGKLLTKSATEYNERRKVWNGMIDKYPALIVLCKAVIPEALIRVKMSLSRFVHSQIQYWT